ncbi:MAG: DUF4349 domain-containing protein [Alphaproteobacteria bacterium]|nr:DUF4349 domain-containing protein [Alphaproteobacteria bacterium]
MRSLLIVLLAAGCARKAESTYAYPAEQSAVGGGFVDIDLYDMEESLDEAPRMAKKESSRGGPYPPPPPPPPAVAGAPSPEPTPQPAEPEAQEAQEAAADRMIHYEGWARLRVTDPEAALDEVVALAEAVGGRTERLSGNTVSIRVPVATFDDTYGRVLGLGDVMDKSVRADDVTDAFMAVDLRAKTLRATQARLVELLAKATDENEKLRLLQEITRVTEQLDAIESQLRTLSDLADMSRISVEAVPREAFGSGGGRPALDGFEWITHLSPFNRGPFWDDKRIGLPVPDGLVALSNKGPFAAESADGAVLWTWRAENDPVGDGAFWIDAVEDRLAEEFAAPTRKDVGGWSCVVLDEPGSDEPYRWQVCAQVQGKWVQVAQAWFPGAEQVERYGAAVDASLKAGGDT